MRGHFTSTLERLAVLQISACQFQQWQARRGYLLHIRIRRFQSRTHTRRTPTNARFPFEASTIVNVRDIGVPRLFIAGRLKINIIYLFLHPPPTPLVPFLPFMQIYSTYIPPCHTVHRMCVLFLAFPPTTSSLWLHTYFARINRLPKQVHWIPRPDISPPRGIRAQVIHIFFRLPVRRFPFSLLSEQIRHSASFPVNNPLTLHHTIGITILDIICGGCFNQNMIWKRFSQETHLSRSTVDKLLLQIHFVTLYTRVPSPHIVIFSSYKRPLQSHLTGIQSLVSIHNHFVYTSCLNPTYFRRVAAAGLFSACISFPLIGIRYSSNVTLLISF